MAGYQMPNHNPEIDQALKRGDQATWGQLVAARFADKNMGIKVDALVEAHYAAETATRPAFREYAARQAVMMDQAMQQTPAGRITLATLKTPGKLGHTRLQQAIDSKAISAGRAISPEHAVLAARQRGVIRPVSQPGV